MEREIYEIFNQHPLFKNTGYCRYLYQEIRRSIAGGTFIYENGTYLDWVKFKKNNTIRLKRIISKYPGMGYGTQVLQKFLAIYPNHTIILDVDVNNTLAILFYTKNGFKYKKKARNNYDRYIYNELLLYNSTASKCN